MLSQIEGESIPPPADAAAIELLGWLELPWDDASALIITGLNEGIVPKSRRGDMFLPDALRRRLHLEDNCPPLRSRCLCAESAGGTQAAAEDYCRAAFGRRRSADSEPIAVRV